MKRITTYWLLAAAMTLAGCASDNDIATEYAGDDNDAVTINATRAATSTSVSSTALAEGETFCLVNETRQSLGRTNKYKAVYEVTSSGIVPEKSAEYVVWQTGKDKSGNEITQNSFRAVIPDDAPLSNFQLPLDQSTADKLKAADWQLASASPAVTAMQAKPTLSLNFEHQMSKLHFTITSTKDDAQSLTSQDFSVLTLITPYYNNTDNTVEAIIDPKWMISVETPLITINTAGNETLSVSIPSGITGFEPGKQYNFNLAIGHDALTISSVSVTDWTPIDLNGKNEVWNKDDDDTEYITFSADSQQGFLFVYPLGYPVDLPGFEYSVNNGEWISIPDEGLNNAVSFGGDLGNLRLRGKNNFGTFSARTVKFTNDVKVACSGDIRTLIDYTQYKTVDTGNALFVELFKDCTQLTSAPMLPSTKLSHDCYRSMFEGCSSLTIAPVLPAGELSSYCYSKMFKNCTSLVSPPYISATTLAYCCCESMFEGCTALKKAPVLPAENLADVCYIYMFQNCTALKTAPSLPATTLAFGCYKYMFSGCTTLTNAPELHATTLADYCYNGMFSGCTALRKAPVLKAENLEDFCYSFMFEGCSNLSSVTMLATDVYGSSRLENWLNGAGTSATSRTLKLHNSSVYNKIKDNNEILPDKWQSGQATIIYEENP